MNRERATPGPAPTRVRPRPGAGRSRSRGQPFEPARQRVVSLIGHRASGKTSLGDLLCKVARVTREVGSVEERSSLLDWTVEERGAGHSLSIAAAWIPWTPEGAARPSDGWTLQLLDVPGSDLLTHERDVALASSDGAVLVVDASAGVEFGTQQALQQLESRALPAVAVLGKLDRALDVEAVRRELQEASRRRAVLVQLPFLDDAGELAGVIDLVRGVVLRFDAHAACSTEPIPDRCQREVLRAREALAESVALTDDDLLERYLEDLELSDEDLEGGIIQGILSRRLLPVLLSSVPRRVGGQPLLDAIGRWLPSPLSRPLPVLGSDGVPQTMHPGEGSTPFVASMVAVGHDADGAPFQLLRVWSGAPPRHGELVHGGDGHTKQIHK